MDNRTQIYKAMTVKELMAELAKYPEDMEVLKNYDDPEHGAHGEEEVDEIYKEDGYVILD